MYRSARVRLALGALSLVAVVVLSRGNDSALSAQGGSPTFSGFVFVDGARADNASVEIRSADTLCSAPKEASPGPSDQTPVLNVYLVEVLTSEDKAGCPDLGEPVTFFVGGREANQHPPLTQGNQNVDLTVGQRLAVFSGQVAGDAGRTIHAVVAGAQCADVIVQPASQLGPAEYQFLIVPEACAGNGATVSFVSEGRTAREQAVWSEGVVRLDLTFEAPPLQVVPPQTGSGGYRRK